MREVGQVLAIVITILIPVTLVFAGVSIRVVLEGLHGPSSSEHLLVRLLARVAGFVIVCGMLSALVYCGYALLGFLGWLA